MNQKFGKYHGSFITVDLHPVVSILFKDLMSLSHYTNEIVPPIQSIFFLQTNLLLAARLSISEYPKSRSFAFPLLIYGLSIICMCRLVPLSGTVTHVYIFLRCLASLLSLLLVIFLQILCCIFSLRLFFGNLGLFLLDVDIVARRIIFELTEFVFER